MLNHNILITGSAGFIGFHLINKLSLYNYTLIGIDNLNDYYDVKLKLDRLRECGISLSGDFNEQNEYKSSKFYNYSFLKGDICDFEFLNSIIKKYNISQIIHLAGQAGVRYSIDNPTEYLNSNVIGFFNILEISRKYQIDKLIYASSSSVYGESEIVPFIEEKISYRPESFYAATKMCNEIMAFSYSKIYNITTIGLRFFTVYGPYGRPDMSPFIFANSLIKNKPISIFNNGLMQRDFTFIDDIVYCIDKLTVIKDLPNYNIFNIGNGAPIALLEFIKLLESEFSLNGEKIYFPMQRGDVSKTWASTIEIEKILGEYPKTDIKDGVKKFVKWYKDYYR